MKTSKSVINEHTITYPIDVQSFKEINVHWKLLSMNIAPNCITNFGLCRF